MREVVNALLYIASSGGAWRLLPTDFPPFFMVQKYFYRWRNTRGRKIAGLKRHTVVGV
jgi:putative transposase